MSAFLLYNNTKWFLVCILWSGLFLLFSFDSLHFCFSFLSKNGQNGHGKKTQTRNAEKNISFSLQKEEDFKNKKGEKWRNLWAGFSTFKKAHLGPTFDTTAYAYVCVYIYMYTYVCVCVPLVSRYFCRKTCGWLRVVHTAPICMTYTSNFLSWFLQKHWV